MFLESTQNQRCFNVEFYRWINVDKSTLNQRGYHVDRRRDVISTDINVEPMLSVSSDIQFFYCRFICKNFVNFLIIEFIFVMVKDTYLLTYTTLSTFEGPEDVPNQRPRNVLMTMMVLMCFLGKWRRSFSSLASRRRGIVIAVVNWGFLFVEWLVFNLNILGSAPVLNLPDHLNTLREWICSFLY